MDLLGFGQRVQSHGCPGVLAAYEQALEELHHGESDSGGIECAWFSDTFLLYAEDDSHHSFARIEQRARYFVTFLTMRHIPFTGALACEELLALKNENIFVGRALVESYRLCERQDWIGYVLSASAVKRMEEIGLPADGGLNYRRWRVPIKRRRRRADQAQMELDFPTLLLGGRILAKNHCYEALREMRIRCTDRRVRVKYGRTLRFLEAVSEVPDPKGRKVVDQAALRAGGQANGQETPARL